MRRMRFCTLFIVCHLLVLHSATQAATIYVDADATGPLHNGTSWCTAFLFVQDALAIAQAEDTIRVAQGTYKPDQGGGQTPGDRTASFHLISGVALEGGYAGCGESDPDARDVVLYESTLSGDLNGQNSYHVLMAVATGANTILDGLSVSGGNADQACSSDDIEPCAGGGIYTENGAVVVRHCLFQSNAAVWGGAIHTQNGSIELHDSVIRENIAVYGGGVGNRESDMLMTNCLIEANEGPWGGGLINEYSSQTTIRDTQFIDNVADGFALGGGMRNTNSNATLIDCLFQGNKAIGLPISRGGGLYNLGNTSGIHFTLINCRFVQNTTAGNGGGLHSNPSLFSNDIYRNCVFVGNTAAGQGGGVYNRSDNCTFYYCRFLGNSAGTWGGGLFNYDSNMTLAGCVFSGNSADGDGGAINTRWRSNPLITNCTITQNISGGQCGGVYSGDNSHHLILNSIIWGNQDSSGTGEAAQVYQADGTPFLQPIIHHSCVQGWSGAYGGSGNIGADPLFVDVDGADDIVGTEDDDMRLLPGSSAIDAGANIGVPHDLADLDGDNDTVELLPWDMDGYPRLLDAPGVVDTGFGSAPIVDMGALEFIADCNGNNIPDATDIAAGTSLDCNNNGLPDECEPLLLDCNSNGVCDGTDVADMTSEDCDGNGVPDECDPDCNGNGTPDQCDITAGASDDCNDDGVPDECLDSSVDCDANGEIDSCETAKGTAQDSNQNGIPDACEPPVVYVNREALGLDNGTSWVDAFTDLQNALTLAARSAGFVQEVWVAEGIYTPDGGTKDRHASFSLPNGVGVYGGFLGNETERGQRDFVANETLLSGDLGANDDDDFSGLSRLENSYLVLRSIETDGATVLDGFTITSGHAIAPSQVDRDRGAGMRNEGSPLLANLNFTNNFAVGGGAGLYSSGSPLVRACQFHGNRSDHWGGGVFVNRAELESTGIEPVFEECIFTENIAMSGGGFAAALQYTGPTLDRCVFRHNTAGSGGAIYNNNNSHPTLINCTLSGNTALGDGGAINNYNGDMTLINCTVAGNVSGGNCGGLYGILYGEQFIYNSNFWGNVDVNGSTEASQLYLGIHLFIAIHYSSVQGLTGMFGGIGNIGADPQFVDADGPDGIAGTEDDDLRLLPTSPCIDAADNTAVPIDVTTDLDGNPRFIDIETIPDTGNGTPPVVDMGPYEHIADCNNNRVPDDIDIESGASDDCNENIIPDECEPDADCNGNDVQDICDLYDGVSTDCNENIIPDECEPDADCNGNGTQDICELFDGTASDCNENATPDECDIADGMEFDINGNGIPDSCEQPFVATLSAVGPRYFALSPAFETPEPVAFRVTSPDYACLEKYVDPAGLLVDEPVFLAAAAWGSIDVHGDVVFPDTEYEVEADFGTGEFGDPISVTTWAWGDCDNNGTANLADTQLVVLGFQGDFSLASLQAVDLEPCLPNGVANLGDALQSVLAFQGVPVTKSLCPEPCP